MSIRTKKVESLLQRELSQIIQRNYQSHGLITITEVKVTPDLSLAKVYFSIFAPGLDSEVVFKQLSDQADAIRYDMSSNIRHHLRKMPELHFHLDDTAAYAQKMDSIFDKIKRTDEPKESDTDSED